MYTFSFVVGSIMPKSVKCFHSGTQGIGFWGDAGEMSTKSETNDDTMIPHGVISQGIFKGILLQRLIRLL